MTQTVSEPPPEKQKEDIKRVINVPLKEGDTWYVIPYKWWIQWKEFVRFDEDDAPNTANNSQRPGPINNSDLLENDRLKTELMEGSDYYLLPSPAWVYLINRYGGGPEIPRKVIRVGMSNQMQVEVYLMKIYVYKRQNNLPLNERIDLEISKSATVKYLRHCVCEKLWMPPHKTRLWGEIDEKIRLLNSDDTLEDARLVDENRVVIDLMFNEHFLDQPPTFDGNATTTLPYTFPVRDDREDDYSYNKTVTTYGSGNGVSHSYSTRGNSYMNSSSNGSSGYNSYNSYGASIQKGVIGLNNLGNTCFMNSALQCLSNTAPLTQYFLAEKYKNEMNRENPLGMGGKIAEHYGDLIKKMWDGKAGCVSPTDFKWVLGKFAPQFSGYRQHDSQELLAFLLDGLHEDLNRVINKPYVETKESDGRPDQIVAAESWDNHLKRNQSVIVDIFMGQLKSTLVCPDCNKVSVTFDPFMYLGLPLPLVQERRIEVVVANVTTGAVPVKYGVKVPKKAKLSDLRASVSEVCNLPAKDLIMTDVCFNRIYSFLEDSKGVSLIRDTDLTVAYYGGTFEEGNYIVQVLQRKPERSSYSSYTNYILMGLPFVLNIPKSTSNSAVYKMVWKMVVRLTDMKNKADEDHPMDGTEQPVEYPFSLRRVARSGTSCDICGYVGRCQGCAVPFDDEPFVPTKDATLSVDWHPIAAGTTVFDDRHQKEVELHPSAKEEHEISAGITIKDCLELFLTKEKLGPDDAWYCPACKDFKQATKQLDLWKLPAVLVVHLKRFQYSRWSRDKLDTFVEFPLKELDLTPYVKTPQSIPPIYDLFAISNHSGGLGGGHYTAYAKNFIDEKWYSFNDSSASEVGDRSVASSAAYVLFYQKRDQEIIPQTPSPSATSSAPTPHTNNNNNNNNNGNVTTTTSSSSSSTTTTSSDSN